MGQRITWRDVKHLTPEHRQWLLRMCDAAVNGCRSRAEAAEQIGVTIPELDEWLMFLTCRTSWPPRFDSGVFQKPVRNEEVAVSEESKWLDQLLSLEESDSLRGKVFEWMRQHDVPVQSVPYACRASSKKVSAFLQGDTCDAYVAGALRKMLGAKPKKRSTWKDEPIIAVDLHRQREMQLLEEERRKYGLKKIGKPLSSMPV
jgi:hypothetical protein